MKPNEVAQLMRYTGKLLAIDQTPESLLDLGSTTIEGLMHDISVLTGERDDAVHARDYYKAKLAAIQDIAIKAVHGTEPKAELSSKDFVTDTYPLKHNTYACGVKITHTPTGKWFSCSTRETTHGNHYEAFENLKRLLNENNI